MEDGATQLLRAGQGWVRRCGDVSIRRPKIGGWQIQDWLHIYRAMMTARVIDRFEADLVRRGEAAFHISGEGHESSAALAPHLQSSDWLACHYRDKALMLARGVLPEAIFKAQLCRAGSYSAGRQLPDILCDAERRILSVPVPVGSHALHAVGAVAAEIEGGDATAIAVCLVGDGTTQQGEFLEAVAEAVRRTLPVLFVIEDNRLAISTRTAGQTCLSLPQGPGSELFGLPVHTIEGRDAIAAYERFGELVSEMRTSRRPALARLPCERLSDHSNADQQTLYRTDEERRQAWHADPLVWTERSLLERGVPRERLNAAYRAVEQEVVAARERALLDGDPTPIFSARSLATGSSCEFRDEYRGTGGPRDLVMREALRDVLRSHLERSPQVFLTGQDLEDPKGDVFGVTKGLSTQFAGRVVNAALSESTIVGTCLGRALAGQRPVAFIQFADFLPLAFNQIMSELATMSWRTNGEYQCPVIVMAACGGYKPGLGPFHSQTMEAVLAHTPGLDVVMPSTAADAAGLLNAAFESDRPTIFLYPKSLLNLASEATTRDVSRQFVPLGKARRIRAGGDLTIVVWGSTVALGVQASETLAAAGFETDLYDLRSLSPWDAESILASVERTGKLLVVHEDNLTCGFGAEILACVAERATIPVKCRRVARPDVFTPCHFESQLAVLPSSRSVLEAAADLLNLSVAWTEAAEADPNRLVIPAIGSGPSDERVLVVELHVRPGDLLRTGDLVATVESAKSVLEIVAFAPGEVETVHVQTGGEVLLGAPLVTLKADRANRRASSTLLTAKLTRKPRPAAAHAPGREVRTANRFVGLGPIVGVTGSRLVGNADLLPNFPARTNDDILRKTGIESRRWVGAGENALSLAKEACRRLLRETGLDLRDISLIVCSTGSALTTTPSLACRILAELAEDSSVRPPAYDINAACSGYLYALDAVYNHLQSEPEARAIVVTAETPSTKTNPRDFDTAFLFGDAATATLVCGESRRRDALLELRRPVLSAKGENGSLLSVPLTNGDQYIAMRGVDVYAEAVPGMISILERACHRQGLRVCDLDLIVPHQANQRILKAIEHQLDRPVFSNIRTVGNTSSSSIPLALREAMLTSEAHRIGLCAFGGGFTFGAAVLDVLNPRPTADSVSGCERNGAFLS
jgi:2-oxoisovalerate dehydrogenase E1 component